MKKTIAVIRNWELRIYIRWRIKQRPMPSGTYFGFFWPRHRQYLIFRTDWLFLFLVPIDTIFLGIGLMRNGKAFVHPRLTLRISQKRACLVGLLTVNKHTRKLEQRGWLKKRYPARKIGAFSERNQMFHMKESSTFGAILFHPKFGWQAAERESSPQWTFQLLSTQRTLALKPTKLILISRLEAVSNPWFFPSPAFDESSIKKVAIARLGRLTQFHESF